MNESARRGRTLVYQRIPIGWRGCLCREMRWRSSPAKRHNRSNSDLTTTIPFQTYNYRPSHSELQHQLLVSQDIKEQETHNLITTNLHRNIVYVVALTDPLRGLLVSRLCNCSACLPGFRQKGRRNEGKEMYMISLRQYGFCIVDSRRQ